MMLVILGGASLLGGEILSQIESRGIDDVRCVEFDDVADLELVFAGNSIVIESFDDARFSPGDVVVVASVEDASDLNAVAKALVERAKECYLIDCTNVLSQLPLALSGAPMLNSHCRIAHSNAAHLQKILNPLLEIGSILKISIMTLEPVSTAGQAGIDELWQQGLAIYNSGDVPTEYLQAQLAFSFIPHVGVVQAQGETSAEALVAKQLSSLVRLPEEIFQVQMVRVPVFYGCGHVINVDLKDSVNSEDVIAALKSIPECEYFDPSDTCRSHLSLAQSETIQIGRFRKVGTNSFSFWAAADNISHVGSAVVEVLDALSKRRA